MKVYSYLQLQYQPEATIKAFMELHDLKHEDEIKHIYSEPFKPEMIVERFKGWKLLIPPKTQTIIATHFPYDIVFHEMTPNCMTICTDDNGDVTDDFIKPRNLDEFIVQCQQAGIELEWKR